MKTVTLDIFATNRPTLVNKCIPIPGISDRESIYVESCIKAKYRQPTRRKIFWWAKADFQHISQILNESVAAFLDTHTLTSSVHQMWSDFMDIYAKCLEFVPQKLSSIRFSQPWVTSKTKCICRKKKRLYNKARNSGLTRDWNDYLNVKNLAQHECRAAYHEYVSHLIDPHTNNKKFWSHIKSCRKDYTGISTLIILL